MRVVATAVGADNLTRREPGEEFDMPDGSKGSWFEPAVDGDGEKGVETGEKPKARRGKHAPPDGDGEKGVVIPPDPAT